MSSVRSLAAEGTPRWLGVGRSSESNARVAGKAAARDALRGHDPRLLLVFASERYALDGLLGAIRAEVGNVPLIGATSAGEIATAGPSAESVVVVAWGGPGFSVATSVAANVSRRLRAAGAEVASSLSEVAVRSYRILLLFTDGAAGDQQEIIRGAYGVAGAGVPLVGGCAGSVGHRSETAQFFDQFVLRDAVVAAAIGSDTPFGVGVRHGWRPVGEPMVVDRSFGNRVFLLDGRPSLDVYLDRLGAPAEARANGVAFTQFALKHPLGFARRTGEPLLRRVDNADFDGRSLGCLATVPQGEIAWAMEGDAAALLGATDAACREAVEALGGRPPLGLLAFDSDARREVLGDRGTQEEVFRMFGQGQESPVAGFYTSGTIARTSGATAWHNQTLVMLAVS